MVRILTRNLSHRKHVFRDLRPYVCLVQDCSTPDHQYLRRREWIKHMELEHWRVWQCTWGCASRTFSTARGFRDHLSAIHGQLMTGARLETFTSLRSCADHSKAVGKCPLCLSYHTKSCSDYARHIGRHLERLALFTIPKATYEYDSDEQDPEQRDGEGTGTESARDHPLYKNAYPQADGLFHCPWEGQPSCQHKPEKLKCNYE